MSVLIAELGWDEDGRARKWAVPSTSRPGYFVLVVREEGLTCTCPAGGNARANKGRPNPTWCIHARLVTRLEQERYA